MPCRTPFNCIYRRYASGSSGRGHLCPVDGGHVTDVDEVFSAIMKDADPAFVLFSTPYLAHAAHIRTPYGCLEDTTIGCLQPRGNPSVAHVDDCQSVDAAYTIYELVSAAELVSASVSHRTLVDALYISPDGRPVSAGSAQTTHTTDTLDVASDLYARQVLGCLANGGTLYLNTKDQSVMLPL